MRALRRACFIAIAFLLAAAAAQAQAAPQLTVVQVSVGSLEGGAFVPRPNRVFRAGEVVAAQALIRASAAEGCALSVEARLLHPLGAAIAVSRSSVQLGGAGEWQFTFSYQLPPDAPSGYYRVEVSAEACGGRAEGFAVFYYEGVLSLENYVELEYGVVLKGAGEVDRLVIALPNDPSLELNVRPLALPSPRRTLVDSFGNSYAVYENLRVNGELAISIRVAAVQQLVYVNADAPLGVPPPKGLEAFLKPAPYIESDHPSVISLARELVSGARTYREAAARIADWVSSNVVYDASLSARPDYERLGALWTLNARRGACLQISRLFVALARAAGIPARLVEGFAIPPSGVEGATSAHMFAEVYIPGYGWLPVEPQRGGRWLGFAPPAPGYIALVRGAGEPQGVEGLRASIAEFRYRGSVSAQLVYSARIQPAGPPPPRLVLSVEVPRAAYYGDRLVLRPAAMPAAECEVSVSGPGYTASLRLPPGGSAEIELNGTGTWLIEVFAWKTGYLPAYASATVEVKPRPLNLSVRVEEALLLRAPRVVARVEPPVEGVPIRLIVGSCHFYAIAQLRTDERGEAAARLEQWLLPCPLEVRAEVAHSGYEAKAAEATVWPLPSPELAAAIATAAAAAIALRRLRARPRGPPPAP